MEPLSLREKKDFGKRTLSGGTAAQDSIFSPREAALISRFSEYGRVSAVLRLVAEAGRAEDEEEKKRILQTAAKLRKSGEDGFSRIRSGFCKKEVDDGKTG